MRPGDEQYADHPPWVAMRKLPAVLASFRSSVQLAQGYGSVVTVEGKTFGEIVDVLDAARAVWNACGNGEERGCGHHEVQMRLNALRDALVKLSKTGEKSWRDELGL